MDTALVAFLTAAFSAGSAWGGAWMALNGTKKNVIEIKEDVREIRTRVSNHGERIARAEAQVESMVE